MSLDYKKIILDHNKPKYLSSKRSGTKRRYFFFFFLFLLLSSIIWFFASGTSSSLYSRFFSSSPSASTEFSGSTSSEHVDLANNTNAIFTELNKPTDSVSESNISSRSTISTTQANSVASLPTSSSAEVALSQQPTITTSSSSSTNSSLSTSGSFTSSSSSSTLPINKDESSVISKPQSVLPPVKAELKNIDTLLTSNPHTALSKLLALSKLEDLSLEDSSEIYYRLGYVSRLLKSEEEAEKYWDYSATTYPDTRGGRYSALALAETLFRKYATTNPNTSHWDDISRLYSISLGKDDAPFMNDSLRLKVKNNLRKLNSLVFFSTAPNKLAKYHTISNGELLGSIANKYRVDYESIAKINSIDPNRIRAGMDLKILPGEVTVIVRKHSTDKSKSPTLTWFLADRWVAEYPACVGEGSKTPAGTYSISLKERFPSWTNPLNGQLLPNDHPDNILGTRWLAMKGMNTSGLGIHGTTIPDSIPGYTSAGCVRLLNSDVEELFSFMRLNNKVIVLE